MLVWECIFYLHDFTSIILLGKVKDALYLLLASFNTYSIIYICISNFTSYQLIPLQKVCVANIELDNWSLKDLQRIAMPLSQAEQDAIWGKKVEIFVHYIYV